MNGARLVGVVGGYGAVGRTVVAALRRHPDLRLRIGGRNLDRAVRLVRDELAGGAEPMAVDVYDEASLARFCAGCAVVVHTGAASYQVLDRVARAARAAGADYVDSGGDLPLHHRLVDHYPPTGTGRALVTAGMMPGLSGLLPRWLAIGYQKVHRLVAYIGVVDRLTPAGAVDYLLSLAERERESQAAWIGGRRVERAATPVADTVVPFFPGRVAVYPYLSYEAERFAAQLGVAEVRWHSVFDQGGNMMAALSRLQGAMSGRADPRSAARELAAAAELDLFGRKPYQLMLFEMSGADRESGRHRATTLMVRSANTSHLTGTVCALATRAVLDGRTPPGAHFAAEALDPRALVSALRDTGGVRAFEVCTGGLLTGATEGSDDPEPSLVDEGAL